MNFNLCSLIVLIVVFGEWMTVSARDRNGGNSFTRIGAVSSLQLARERAASGDQPSIARAPVGIAPTVRAVTEGFRGLAGAPAVNVTVSFNTTISATASQTKQETTTRRTFKNFDRFRYFSFLQG